MSRRMHNGRLAPRPNRKVTRRESRRIVGGLMQVVGATRSVAAAMRRMAVAFDALVTVIVKRPSG
jgi:hypothetical protein